MIELEGNLNKFSCSPLRLGVRYAHRFQATVHFVLYTPLNSTSPSPFVGPLPNERSPKQESGLSELETTAQLSETSGGDRISDLRDTAIAKNPAEEYCASRLRWL